MKDYLSLIYNYLTKETIFRSLFFQTPYEPCRKYTYEEIVEMMNKPLTEEDIKRINSKFPIDFARKVHAIGGTCTSDPNLEERV